MEKTVRKLLLFVSIGLIASCASKPAPPTVQRVPPIRSIAIVTGDPLASAVGTELFNQGFRTFELPAKQELTPKALQSLARGGVDGVLVITSVKRGFDPIPESASLRLLRTQNGETVVAFTWSNSAAGAPSVADSNAVRKGLADIARQLVRTLMKTVPKPA
jgi:hypothetical protein